MSTGSSVIDDVIKEEEEEDLEDEEDYETEEMNYGINDNINTNNNTNNNHMEQQQDSQEDLGNDNVEELNKELLEAATNNAVDGVRMLLAKHKDKLNVNYRSEKDEQTPLISAAKNGHVSILKILLEQEKIDPNACNKYGNHPLSIATYFNHVECVGLLLEHPRIDINQPHAEGDTALSIAKTKEYNDILELFNYYHDTFEK